MKTAGYQFMVFAGDGQMVATLAPLHPAYRAGDWSSQTAKKPPTTKRPITIDYLYTSLTNATAFSPTDTMPLSPMAKSVMGVQSIVSLVTIGLIVSRAVNILAA